jgi:hypothetical protein
MDPEREFTLATSCVEVLGSGIQPFLNTGSYIPDPIAQNYKMLI